MAATARPIEYLAEYSSHLQKVLGLKGSPVSVTLSDKPPVQASGGKSRTCKAILAARDGELVDISRDNCSCRGL